MKTLSPIILILALFFTSSLAFAQERPKAVASEEPEQVRFQTRVAELLGMNPQVVRETMTALPLKAGFGDKESVVVLIFAQKRTMRLADGGTITSDEEKKVFQEGVRFAVEYSKKTGDWRETVSDETGLEVQSVSRQAVAIVREARLAAKSEPGESASKTKEERSPKPGNVPDYLSQFLAKRFRLRPEVITNAWGELEEAFGKGALKGPVMLLIFAKARTDMFLEVGAISRNEREENFLKNARFFADQYRRRVDLGDLGIQVSKHVHDVTLEAVRILRDAQSRQSEGTLREEVEKK